MRRKAFAPLLKEVLREFWKPARGKPFILMLWSLECQYCPAELKMLSELKRSNPKMDVVLIATDTVSDVLQLKARAQKLWAGRDPAMGLR